MLPNETQTDPRVLRTRQLIEEAFLEILSEKTLHALTVRDVTRRAGINRATFYAHFFDKYALFSHIVRKTFLQTLGEYISADAAFSQENLLALVRAVCHYFVYLNSQCPPTDRQLRPVAETEVQQVVFEHLVGWLQVESAADVALLATYLSWGIFGVGLAWVGNRSDQAVEETAVRLYHLVQATLRV
ncbi:MAG: TetR/AcrR family transcriptional regulator [Anaerolineales bacterium]|nr:TetR/AcrR family transcriptional regulator [Anaerolineales bacterium]